MIVIFNMNPAKPTEGWNQIMTLPRRITLTGHNEIGIEPAGDIESLRGFRLADTPSDMGKYGAVNAIDLSTGRSEWRFSTTNTVCGDPAIAYGRLYFASRDGRVYCCAPADEGEPMTPEAKDQTPPVDEADVAKLLSTSHDHEPKRGANWPMLVRPACCLWCLSLSHCWSW